MCQISLTDILTIIALFLNFAALCIVGYQTYLNRRSLQVATQSIDEDRKTRQIEMLPRAHFIFLVQANLQRYVSEMDSISKALSDAVSDRSLDGLKDVSAKAIHTPKGLVDKFSYENGPAWLAEIWLAGAQYHYDFRAPLRSLWNERDAKPFWELAPGLIDRGKSNAHHIRELMMYIEQVVPEAYANAPASISDSSFLSD